MGSKFLRILMVLAFAGRALAATVTGTFKLADGTAYTSSVTFRPVSSPALSGADVITGSDIKVTPDEDGFVSTSLSAGYYSVFLGSTRRFTIAVPADTDTVDVTSILTTPAWLVPGEAGISGIITNTYQKASTTAFGTVKIDTASTNPVVYLKDSVDALVAPLGTRLNGLQLVASEAALSSTDPTNGYSARVFTGSTSADWVWNAAEGGPDVSGERVRPSGYVTGSWIKTTAWATSKSLGANKAAVLDSTGQLAASASHKEQVDNAQAQFAAVTDMMSFGSGWSAGTIAYCGGRTNRGDGGGGTFRLVSTSGLSTNWGTVFASSSASYYWQRIQESQVVDLRWYAPIRGQGNGTLNTTKIQQALDYAATLKGAQVFVCDHYYIGEGATAGVGLKLGLNTRIVGGPAQPFTEVSEATSSSSYYGGGYIGGFRTENSANIVLIDFDSTGGYLRQTAQTIWDGTSVAEKRYVSSGVYGILLDGNRGNNQNTALPMVRATSAWNVTIENVGFLNAAGPVAWFRDCNGVIFRGNNIVSGRGVIFDDCGDYDILANWNYGSQGPSWRFVSSWKGTVVDNQTGNSIAGLAGTISSVSGNVLTSTNHNLYTGGLVWIRSTATTPSPLVSTRPYYAIRLSANTFSVASTLANADAGTAVTLTTGGSGTITFDDGPNVSYHMVSPSGGGTSGSATGTVRNSFVANRSDQTLQGGWFLDGASQNTFSGNYVIEAKFGGSGTVPAVTLTNSASNNVLGGFYVDSSADIGFLIGDNCNNNLIGPNSISSATALSISATGTSGNGFVVPGYGTSTNISVGSVTSSSSVSGLTAAFGSAGSGTVATFTGGVGGASILSIARSGQPTIGFKSSRGLQIADDTNVKNLGSIVWNSTFTEWTIGWYGTSTPSTSVLQGDYASGSNIAGKELRLLSGTGTGNASTSSAYLSFWTPVAGASGSTSQTMIERARFDSTVSATATGGWIFYNGTLKQIEVGASDSGGVGYRMLRITN